MIGVFAATDVFLFYVLFEAMLIPMYFIIGRYGGPQRSYAAVKFLLYSLFGGLLMLAAVIGLYVVSRRRRRTPSCSRTSLGIAHRAEHREAAVPRLLHRLRDQGAAVAGAHLAAGRRGRGPARRRRAARRRARQGRHVRHAAVLPAAVPGRVAVGHAGRHHARA